MIILQFLNFCIISSRCTSLRNLIKETKWLKSQRKNGRRDANYRPHDHKASTQPLRYKRGLWMPTIKLKLCSIIIEPQKIGLLAAASIKTAENDLFEEKKSLGSFQFFFWWKEVSILTWTERLSCRRWKLSRFSRKFDELKWVLFIWMFLSKDGFASKLKRRGNKMKAKVGQIFRS